MQVHRFPEIKMVWIKRVCFIYCILNFFLNTIYYIFYQNINLVSSPWMRIIRTNFWSLWYPYSHLDFSYADVSEGAWSKDELVESSHKRSHEGVWFSDINFAWVVNIEFSPGSWEEFSHVCFHLSFWYLFSDEEDFSRGLLGTILVEDFLSSGLSSSISNWDGVVVEDVIHNIVLISTIISRWWSISGGWWWVIFHLFDGNSFGGSDQECKSDNACEFHFSK